MVEKIVSILWGNLKGNESRKFFYLAMGAFCLVGAQWPIKVLRDSIFINTVGSAFQPNVKMFALMFCIPLTLLYTVLVSFFPREKTLYIIASVFGVVGMGFVGLLHFWSVGAIANQGLLGWSFYIFAASFDAFTVAPYWAFINDITYPGEAKRGYGMVIFAAQLGGLVFTALGNMLSRNSVDYRAQTPLIALISVMLLPCFAFFVWKTMRTVRHQNLIGYKPLKGVIEEKPRKSAGFFEGIKLLFLRPYVAGIFALTMSQEIISALMSYRLYRVVEVWYLDHAVRHMFFFNYSLIMQAMAVAFALFGTSFFQRKLGIRCSIVIYPVFLLVCALTTAFSTTLLVVAFSVAIAKALHYTFNKPAREVLYIPTSVDVKYKSKAWIEVFGARSAKMTGAMFSKVIGDVPVVAGCFVLAVSSVWIVIANKVGCVYHSIVKERESIG